jgi:hypothetical protein
LNSQPSVLERAENPPTTPKNPSEPRVAGDSSRFDPHCAVPMMGKMMGRIATPSTAFVQSRNHPRAPQRLPQETRLDGAPRLSRRPAQCPRLRRTSLRIAEAVAEPGARSGRPGSRDSGLLGSVYVAPVLDRCDSDLAFLFIDLIDDPEVAAAGTIGTLQVEPEGLSDPIRIFREAAVDELHARNYDLLREPVE